MAWPFRRKRSRATTEPGRVPDPPVRRGAWRDLPPPALAVRARPPVTVAAAEFGRSVAASRPMLARPSSARPERPVGLVHGMARARAARRADEAPADDPAERVAYDRSTLPTPALVHRRAAVVEPPAWVAPVAALEELPPAPVLAPTVDLRPPPAAAPRPVVAPVAPPPAPTPDPPAAETDAVEDGPAEGPPAPPVPPAPPAPARTSLARSRRLGLGPAYHGPLPEALVHLKVTGAEADDGEPSSPPPPSPPPAPAAGPVTEPVPPDVRDALRHAFGDDVGAQPVRRGPEVSEEARELGARAFARDGEVFVPAEEGELHQPHVKGMVAHELTRLAQQRRAGGRLPPESSDAGQRLEAAAQAAERHARGDAGAAPPTGELVSVEEMMRELIDTGVAFPDGQGGVVFTPPPPGGRSGVQRLTQPAPSGQATGSSGWGRRSEASAFSTFLHDVGEDVLATVEEVAVSSFGLSDQTVQELDHARQNRESRFQAEARFRRQRLEHLARPHRRPGATEVDVDELPAPVRRRLEETLDREVEARAAALEARARERLAAVNADRTGTAGRAPVEELTPARFRELADRAFGEPDHEPLPGPTDTPYVPPDDRRDLEPPPDAGAPAGGQAAPTTGPQTAAPPGGGTTTGAPPTGPQGAGLQATATPVAAPLPGGGRVAGGADRVGGGPSGRGGQADQPRRSEFSSRRDITDALLLDMASFATSPWGVELSRDEQRDLLGHDRPEWGDAGGGRPPAGLGVGRGAAGPAPGTPPPAQAQAGGAGATRADGTPAESGTQAIGTRPEGQRDVNPSGHEQLDLDHLDMGELARRLYPRLSEQLRRDLTVARERSGRSADTT